MRSRTGDTVVRWLLLASVVFGIMIMHHVSELASEPSSSTSEAAAGHFAHAATASAGAEPPMDQHPAPDPGPEDDVLHQCMAVIQHAGLAMIILLLLIGAVALVAVTRPWLGTAPMRAPARPPPTPAGRDLLHSVCVARL